MDDGRGSGVEKMKALQNLPAPASQHLGFHDLEPLEITAGMKDKKKRNHIRIQFYPFFFVFFFFLLLNGPACKFWLFR